MMYEGRGTRKGKGKKKRSAVSGQRSAVIRKWRAAKRLTMNILAGIGIIVVVVWMFQFVIGQ